MKCYYTCLKWLLFLEAIVVVGNPKKKVALPIIIYSNCWMESEMEMSDIFTTEFKRDHSPNAVCDFNVLFKLLKCVFCQGSLKNQNRTIDQCNCLRYLSRRSKKRISGSNFKQQEYLPWSIPKEPRLRESCRLLEMGESSLSSFW